MKSAAHPRSGMRGAPSLATEFTPKLLTVVREGYRAIDLRADIVAGLTVAIVALPLSMAIAIASGVTPDRGLYTAIVGGFIVSALGGSRFQIGGPAGAFIVLVSSTVGTYGVDGMVLATLMAGVLLLLIGGLRLGTFIRYIPYPVTVGFTAGIAVIIFASQIRELLGLTLPGAEPAALLPKLQALAAAAGTFNASAVAITLLTIGAIVTTRHLRPRWPAYLIGVSLASVAVVALSLPVATIGTRFGGIPHTLPAPHLPDMSTARIVQLLPTALSFALLGAIESLLSAVVADGMSGRRHRSNGELAAQGLANIASAIFGGMCVTGTIARTATNVRAGARGPVSGMLHAVFLLAFMVLAAPLASYIPLCALAGVLAVVCWSMAERHQFAMLVRSSPGDAIVVCATSLTVVFRDLTKGIALGFTLGVLLFVHRMATAVEIDARKPASVIDGPRRDVADGPSFDPALSTDSDVVIFQITGAFFFGAAATVGLALDTLADHPKAYVIDLAAAPFFDSTAAATLHAFADKARGRGAAVVVSGAGPAAKAALQARGFERTGAIFASRIEDAVVLAHEAAASRAMAETGS